MPRLSIEVSLSLGSQVPVILQVTRKGAGRGRGVVADEEGNPHPLLILVDGAGLEHENRHRRVLAQSVGDGEATGSSADNNVVILV